MGKVSIDIGGKRTLMIPFTKNDALNLQTWLRVTDNTMGDSDIQPFIIPFDGELTVGSVSWKVFNRDSEIRIFINAVQQGSIVSTIDRELLLYSIPVVAGDELSVDTNENPAGSGNNADLFFGLLLEGA